MNELYSIPLTTLDNRPTTLAEYAGKVLVIVNVASKCGFTGQYAGLEELYRKHKDAGLVVLGFPCNQFMGQEPGNAEEIQKFCSLKYEVSFPMFAKLNVNGKETHPLYRFLKSAKRGTLGTTGIKWNFTKFVVNRAGEVVGRYGPGTAPAALDKVVGPLLAV